MIILNTIIVIVVIIITIFKVIVTIVSVGRRDGRGPRRRCPQAAARGRLAGSLFCRCLVVFYFMAVVVLSCMFSLIIVLPSLSYCYL